MLIVVLFSCTPADDDDPPTPPVPPPTAAILVAPINNETCEQGVSVSNTQSRVSFQWNTAQHTDSYDLSVTNLNTNQVVVSQQGIVGLSKEVSLTVGTPYTWHLTSRSNSHPQTANSASWKFYLAAEGITNYAPFPADLTAPLSGATVNAVEGKITMSWEGADPDPSDVLTYTLYLDNIDGLQDPLAELTNLSVTNMEVSVAPDTVYYWRVKTFDGQHSSLTFVQTFRTAED